MKKHIYSLFAAALLVFCAGCSNDDDGPAISDKGVVGEWHLTSWNHETPADFDVYVQFGADGKFDIFQKVETSAYVRYSGRFAASDSRLSGRYSDGVAWSTDYTFELSDNGDTLTMTSATEGAEVSVYTRTPIPEEVLRECLEAASRASTCGNMQLYSLVVTRDAALRERLSPCHFDQPMVREAPCVVTVCADIHRFTMWCEQRDADPAYDNFAWFLNASTDALLAAQNLCVEAEMHGLGICYLGTTIYTAGDISQILELPKGVIPLTTVVLGYPDESPELTDRLPLEAVVHYEKYTDYTAAEIDELWAEREESELTKRLLAENGLPNLAQVFTQRRYVRKDNLAISESYFALLKEKGFFNN